MHKLRSFKPARKLLRPDKTLARLRALQQRAMALSRWDNEGGAGRCGPQQDSAMGVPPSRTPALTDAELVQLHIRVVALENLVIALLAKMPEGQFGLVREMADYISPRSGFTHHPVTLHAAAQMIHLAKRAEYFRGKGGSLREI